LNWLRALELLLALLERVVVLTFCREDWLLVILRRVVRVRLVGVLCINII
jgi:hypothetical protein